MRGLKRLIAASVVVLFNLGCGIVIPKPDICAIYSSDSAECLPTDPKKESYDLHTDDMLGYQCFSPKDFGDVKKYLKEMIRRLEAMDGIRANH